MFKNFYQLSVWPSCCRFLSQALRCIRRRNHLHLPHRKNRVRHLPHLHMADFRARPLLRILRHLRLMKEPRCHLCRVHRERLIQESACKSSHDSLSPRQLGLMPNLD